MPLTAAGVAYTISYVPIDGHGTCVITVADTIAATSNIPAIVYTHGAGGARDQFMTLPAWGPLRERWINYGGAIIEGGGGDDDDSGAQGWGNLSARNAYLSYVAYAKAQLNIGAMVVVPRSMGGLVGRWLYAKSPIAGDLSGLIASSAVGTLFVGGDTTASDTAGDYRDSVYHFSSSLWTSYGISGTASYAHATMVANYSDYAPETWPASVWSGKNILELYGDADSTVPFSPRGAGPLRTIWAGQPASDTALDRVGGDHSQGNGTFLFVDEMMAALIDFTNGPPENIPTPVQQQIYKRGQSWRHLGGKNYPLSGLKHHI